MALSYSNRQRAEFVGQRKTVDVDITFDNSYVTGGEQISLSALGLGFADRITISNPGQGYLCRWDGSRTAPKLLLYRQTAATGALVEVPNTTDVSTVVVAVRITGR